MRVVIFILFKKLVFKHPEEEPTWVLPCDPATSIQNLIEGKAQLRATAHTCSGHISITIDTSPWMLWLFSLLPPGFLRGENLLSWGECFNSHLSD